MHLVILMQKEYFIITYTDNNIAKPKDKYNPTHFDTFRALAIGPCELAFATSFTASTGKAPFYHLSAEAPYQIITGWSPIHLIEKIQNSGGKMGVLSSI